MNYLKQNRIWASLLLLLIIVMVILFSYSNSYLETANIKNGELVISSSQITNKIIGLNGNWRFYPNVLLSPSQLEKGPKKESQLVKVPAAWSQVTPPSLRDSLPLQGTYELTLTLPAPGTYALQTFLISSAFKVYCNHDYIGSVGTVGTSKETEKSIWKPSLFAFTTDSTTAKISFQVSNYSCFRGGIIDHIYIGTVENLSDFHTLQTLKSAFLMGVFMSLGFYLLFLTCESHHKKAGYSLFVFCLAGCVFESVIDVGLGMYIFPDVSSLAIIKVEFIAYAIMLASLFYFIQSIYPSGKYPRIRKVIGVLNLIYLGLNILSTSFDFSTRLAHMYVLMLLLNMFYFLYSLYNSVRQKKPYAILSLFSVILLVALCFIQIFLNNIQSSVQLYITNELYTIGIMSFLLWQVNVLLIDVDDAYVNAQQADTMEIAFLQAQISPHFVFNTLNNIYCLMSTDVTASQNLLLNFCDFLRIKHRFDFRKQIVYTLGAELDFLKSYVEIENARLHNQIHLILDIPADLHSLPFLPLILQPLVENSIKHGYSYEELTIKISVTVTPDAYHFIISDTGKGMNKLTLDTLTKNTSSGIGFANINYRLQKCCNESLQIESTPGQGTTIFFKIPKGE